MSFPLNICLFYNKMAFCCSRLFSYIRIILFIFSHLVYFINQVMQNKSLFNISVPVKILVTAIAFFFFNSGVVKASVIDPYEEQKNAMDAVNVAIRAIKRTNLKAVLSSLNQLQQIPYDQVADPLSILHAFVNGIGDGRENFMFLALKNAIFIEMRRMAQQVFQAVVKREKFVTPRTKAATLEKLNGFRKVLDPRNEPCASVMKNIDYIICVVDVLPENDSIAWDSLRVVASIVQAVAQKKISALKDAAAIIYQRGKELYEGTLLTQISAVEVLGISFLEQGDRRAFNQLVTFYNSTKLPAVQYEILKIFGKLTRMHYGNEPGGNRYGMKDDAYKAFTILLEAVQSTKFFPFPKLWWVRCAAAEELTLLEYRLKDANARKTVQRYLQELAVKEEKQAKKILRRLSRKVGQESTSDYVLCALNNSQDVYAIVSLQAQLETTKEVVKSNDQMLEEIYKDQKEILKLLKRSTIQTVTKKANTSSRRRRTVKSVR